MSSNVDLWLISYIGPYHFHNAAYDEQQLAQHSYDEPLQTYCPKIMPLCRTSTQT